MRKAFAFTLAALSLVGAPTSAEEQHNVALPLEAKIAVHLESPRRSYDGAYDSGCAVRWERAYDGWGGYVGDRKVRICN